MGCQEGHGGSQARLVLSCWGKDGNRVIRLVPFLESPGKGERSRCHLVAHDL